MNLLFHCCCAPCATACIENLSDEGIAPVLFWYNPNIHLSAEYQSRRDALATLASVKNLKLETIDEYGLLSFLRETGSKTQTPERCGTCYRMRLEQTVSWASGHGFDTFSTSLLISPYQQHDTIRRIGEDLASQYGMKFLYRDFRPLFRQGQAKARVLGLYMQKYCGCIFSDAEKNAKNERHDK
jgi:predicted adenine nucleotide alpha hydrolase (AANH) superfamily ATPase